MSTIQENIEHIHCQIRSAEEKFSRPSQSVQLLAVSKTKPIEALEQAIAAGQRQFGENYVQEGVDKIHYFTQHYNQSELEWHFIGPIQSNKTRLIAENFDWVHSVDREKIAQRLNDQRVEHVQKTNTSPLQVLIQVNTSGEKSKSGIDHTEVFALAQLINTLPNLTLRGLMSIPENVPDHQSQLAAFQQLAQLHQKLKALYPQVDTLSMGMSGDMQAAIEAGSTMVRIGTAIFGARDYSQSK